MLVRFNAKIRPSGRESELTINGQPLPNVRAFSLHTSANEVSRLHVETLLLEPIELTGEAELMLRTRVVSREIARQTYENLKRYFKEEKNED